MNYMQKDITDRVRGSWYRSGKTSAFSQIAGFTAVILAAVMLIMLVSPISARASDDICPKAFVYFKIGSKNYTKVINKKVWMDKTDFFDGVIEIYLKNHSVKGKAKAGSKVRYKLKNGFKLKLYYNDGNRTRTIKNGSKLKKWNADCFISGSMTKGKYSTYFTLINMKGDENN